MRTSSRKHKTKNSVLRTFLDRRRLTTRPRRLKLGISVHLQASTSKNAQKKIFCLAPCVIKAIRICSMIKHQTQILWVKAHALPEFFNHNNKFRLSSISSKCSNSWIYLNSSIISPSMAPILPQPSLWRWYLAGGKTCLRAGRMSYLTSWPCLGASTNIHSSTTLQMQPATCKWSKIRKIVRPSQQINLLDTIMSCLTVSNRRRSRLFHFKLRQASVAESPIPLPGTSYLRFLWPTSKSGSQCSSSTCNPNLSPISPFIGHHLTTRWRTSILIFSSTYFIWKVQKRHWRETTTRRSWSYSVIIDSMDHSWSPWIKTKPLMSLSVSR